MVMWWWSRMIILEPNRRMLTCIEFYYITIWLLNRNHSFKPPPQICICICICVCICVFLLCLYLSYNISNPLFKLSASHYTLIMCTQINACLSQYLTNVKLETSWILWNSYYLVKSSVSNVPPLHCWWWMCWKRFSEIEWQILGKNHVCESCKICQVPNWVSTENLAEKKFPTQATHILKISFFFIIHFLGIIDKNGSFDY